MKHTNTILITGASGMIGSALLRVLKDRGYKNLLSPTHKELELTNQKAVAEYFKKYKPHYVFHLAARVGGIHANDTYPADFIYENTQMQCNVFEAAHRTKVKKILFPGSACTYPKFAPQPVKESEFLNGAIEPSNIAYAAAKINGIVMAQSFAKQYGISVVMPMPTNSYGVGDNFEPKASHVIPALMQRFHQAKKDGTKEVALWGSGKPLREFIYVDDVADAFLFLMERYDKSEIINVGTEQEITIGELAKKIAAVVGYKGKLVQDTSKPDGAPRKCLDSQKLRDLGWKPSTSLDEGLKTMYRHHFNA